MPHTHLAQRIAAKAVIQVGKAILVLHPSALDRNRNWHIPGGIRDDINEPILQTVIREVLEETGLDLTDYSAEVCKVGEWQGEDKGEDVKVLAIFFWYKLPKRPVITLSDEHDDFAWMTVKNQAAYKANPEVYELVGRLPGS